MCDICLGAEPRFSLQDRILNAVLFVSTVVAFLSLVIDWIQNVIRGLSHTNFVYTLFLTLAYGTLYFIGRRRPGRGRLVWPYIVLTLAAPVLAWYYMGGITGTSLLYAMALMLVIPLIATGGKRILAALTVVLSVLTLYFLELSGTVDIVPYAEFKIELFDTLFTFLFVTLGYNMVISLVLRASNRKQERIEELNRTKDRFLSIIGHDLKGPLGNIMSLSDILSQSHDHLDEATRNKLVDSLHSSSRHSLKLVENLLLWARSSSGIMEASPSAIDLDAKVRESIEILSENLNTKHIKLVENLHSDVRVWADPDMLHTIIRNLLSNAIKFTPEEGIIEVSTEKDRIRNTAQIVVRDTGVGMAPEVMRSLLDFETSHSTPGTNNESGTGLGLKLCKEFIDKNQGTLDISSEENKGSEFKVTLPVSN